MIRQSYYNPNSGSHVKLDEYISDLNLEISPEGYSCQPMCKDGFAYMWAGAKATYGVRRGKVCFEVKVAEELEVSTADFTDIHVVRVGWSTDSATLQLGEDKYSYGYGGTAKKSEARRFADYGRRFGKGDVIGCYLAIENGWADFFYCVNGRHCGSAFKVKWSAEESLFPHVLTKNCRLEINFGQAPNPYFSLQPGFKLIDHTPVELRVPSVRPPASKRECEVIMMVGLPGVGKSTWAMNYCKLHPSKKYNILGTDAIIDKMRVQGLPRKNNFGGRWDVLIKQASECFNALLKKASNCNRNLILDQTNVYASARKRKVRQYKDAGYTVNAMVLVPTDEEMMRRSKQRTIEEGKEVPDAAVFDMKANFSLPHEDENLFNTITFLELQRNEAENLVIQYNGDANLRGYKSNKQSGLGANQNQQEKNQLSRGFKPESRPSPRDSSRSRDRTDDTRGSGNPPRDGHDRSHDRQERRSRWDRQEKSPRSEPRKRPDEERRNGPPEKYRRDNSPFHPNPPALRPDDRQMDRAQPGQYNPNQSRRPDLPTPHNARNMPPQPSTAFKHEPDNSRGGFPVMNRPQHAQTEFIKQEQFYAESKSPQDMDWQYSDQDQYKEQFAQQDMYGHGTSQGRPGVRNAPPVKIEAPNIRPRNSYDANNRNNQQWGQQGGGQYGDTAQSYGGSDNYGSGKIEDQSYHQGGNYQGYGGNQQPDQISGQYQDDQYGDNYNQQGNDNTGQEGYGQDDYGQTSEQYNAEGEYYGGDEGGQWDQQGNYGADNATYTDEGNWGGNGDYKIKTEANDGYQDDQGYGQYDQYGGNDWNAQEEGENWSGEQDQYQQGGQTGDQSNWDYDQQGDYSYDQRGDSGYNDQTNTGGQLDYGGNQQMEGGFHGNEQNHRTDGRFQGQQDFNKRGQQGSFNQGGPRGDQDQFCAGETGGDAWGGNDGTMDQAEYSEQQWGQSSSAKAAKPNFNSGQRPYEAENYKSGFNRSSGPQSAPVQQRPRPDAFAHAQRPGGPGQPEQFGNRNKTPQVRDARNQRAGGAPAVGGNGRPFVAERPAGGLTQEFGLPKPAEPFIAPRGNISQVRPPQPRQSRRDEPPPPGPRGGEAAWSQSARGHSFNRGERQPNRPSDEISDSTLSKLTSVDFDKLKASLANLRQAQQTQPERKHPYDLSDKEILDMQFPPERLLPVNAPTQRGPGRGFGGPPSRPGGPPQRPSASGDGLRRATEPPGRRIPGGPPPRDSSQDQGRDVCGGQGANDSRRGRPVEPRRRPSPDRRRSPDGRRGPRDVRDKRASDSSERLGPPEKDRRPPPRDLREKQAPDVTSDRRQGSPRDRREPSNSRDKRDSSRSRSDASATRDKPDSTRRNRTDDRRRSDKGEDREKREGNRDRREEPSGNRGKPPGPPVIRETRKSADTREKRPSSPPRSKSSLPVEKAPLVPPKRVEESAAKKELPKKQDAKSEGWNQLKAAEELITKVAGPAPGGLLKKPQSLMDIQVTRPGHVLRSERPTGPREGTRPSLFRDAPDRERHPKPRGPRPRALLETPRPTQSEQQLMEELALGELFANELGRLPPRPRGLRPQRGLLMRPQRMQFPRSDLDLLSEELTMRRPRHRPPHLLGLRPRFAGDGPRRPLRPRMGDEEDMRRHPLIGDSPPGMRPMIRSRMQGPRQPRGLLDRPHPGLLRTPRGVRPMRHPMRPHFSA